MPPRLALWQGPQFSKYFFGTRDITTTYLPLRWTDTNDRTRLRESIRRVETVRQDPVTIHLLELEATTPDARAAEQISDRFGYPLST